MSFIFTLILVLVAVPIGALALFIAYRLCWVGRSRRPTESGFEYVYVNQDGSVRELAEDERSYLSQDFDPCDGGRPYVKSHYQARDGWESLSGFLLRRQVPAGLQIEPVDPDYRASSLTPEDLRQIHEQSGDVITGNADGSFMASKDPELDPVQSFERMKKIMLDRQARDENEARNLKP
ncbi:hypothetical protein [Prosthecobacter sp.]|uniref:hypothetical protein n=1 Tax=Prosthecobacter sp. TaxID=1965333 RepID=UPI003784A5A4